MKEYGSTQRQALFTMYQPPRRVKMRTTPHRQTLNSSQNTLNTLNTLSKLNTCHKGTQYGGKHSSWVELRTLQSTAASQNPASVVGKSFVKPRKSRCRACRKSRWTTGRIKSPGSSTITTNPLQPQLATQDTSWKGKILEYYDNGIEQNPVPLI